MYKYIKIRRQFLKILNENSGITTYAAAVRAMELSPIKPHITTFYKWKKKGIK